MELIRIRNIGSEPIKLRCTLHGHRVVKPYSEQVLPVEYGTLAFGNPAVKNDAKRKYHDEEYKRVRRRLGFVAGIDAEEDWETVRPKFEVYDMDGERVWMVLDDPDGTKGRGAAQVDFTGGVETNERIAQLERQLQLLLAQQGTGQDLQAPTPSQPLSDAVRANAPGAGEVTVDGDVADGGDGPDDVLYVEGAFDPNDPLASVPVAGGAPDKNPSNQSGGSLSATGESQADRNEQRDTIPKPDPSTATATKDRPRTSRTGAR